MIGFRNPANHLRMFSKKNPHKYCSSTNSSWFLILWIGKIRSWIHGIWDDSFEWMGDQNRVGHLPSLKLTARTWKWMVGIRSFPFGARPIFRGDLLVSGSVGLELFPFAVIYLLSYPCFRFARGYGGAQDEAKLWLGWMETQRNFDCIQSDKFSDLPFLQEKPDSNDSNLIVVEKMHHTLDDVSVCWHRCFQK